MRAVREIRIGCKKSWWSCRTRGSGYFVPFKVSSVVRTVDALDAPSYKLDEGSNGGRIGQNVLTSSAPPQGVADSAFIKVNFTS